jgi:anti-sigma B factor antagonist
VIGRRSLEGGADAAPEPASAAAGPELRSIADQGERLLLAASVPAPGVHLVRAWGELDIAGAEQLAACLAGQIAHRPAQLIVDLAGLSFLGDSGISVLVRARTVAERAGTRLHVAGTATPAVRSPMHASRLLTVFGCYPTAARAFADLHR